MERIFYFVGIGILVNFERRIVGVSFINVIIGFFKKFIFFIRILDVLVFDGIFFMKFILIY